MWKTVTAGFAILSFSQPADVLLRRYNVDTRAVSERVCVGFHCFLILASFSSLSLHTGGRWHGVRKGSSVSKQTLSVPVQLT